MTRYLKYALVALLLATVPASAAVWQWSQTAASNANSDATINWAEGQSPGSVNDSARAMMAAIAGWRDDLAGVKPSNAQIEVGGTTSAYTLTSNQGLTALTNGFTVTFKVGADLTNADGVTLAVDGLTAKNIVSVAGAELIAGTLVEGSLYTVTYHQPDDEWILHGFYAGSASAVPVGTVIDFAGSTAPDGYFLCYGQEVSRTTYAALFDVIGTTYGPGDGSTTFDLPDCRGRVVAGKDDMGGVSANRLTDQPGGLDGDTLGDTGGAETHTLTEAQMPSHNHGVNDPGHLHQANRAAANLVMGTDGPQSQVSGAITSQNTNSNTTGITIQSSGDDDPHNNVQPTIIFNKAIKY